MEDDAVGPWAKNNKRLLMLPMMKFVMGCMCYMLSVILTSWRDLSSFDEFRVVAFFIGAMSMTMVWGAFFVIELSMASRAVAPAPSGKRAGEHLA